MVVLGLILILLGVLVGGYTVMGGLPSEQGTDVSLSFLGLTVQTSAVVVFALGALTLLLLELGVLADALRRPQVRQAPGRAAPPAPGRGRGRQPPVRRGPAQRHRDHRRRPPRPRSPGATPPVTPAARRRSAPTAPTSGNLSPRLVLRHRVRDPPRPRRHASPGDGHGVDRVDRVDRADHRGIRTPTADTPRHRPPLSRRLAPPHLAPPTPLAAAPRRRTRRRLTGPQGRRGRWPRRRGAPRGRRGPGGRRP